VPWSLDSSGFTELSYTASGPSRSAHYVAEVRRYVECIGTLEWASCQDLFCVDPLCGVGWRVQHFGLEPFSTPQKSADPTSSPPFLRGGSSVIEQFVKSARTLDRHATALAEERLRYLEHSAEPGYGPRHPAHHRQLPAAGHHRPPDAQATGPDLTSCLHCANALDRCQSEWRQ